MIAHEAALHFAAQGIIGVERDDLGFVPQRQLGVPTRQGGLGLHVPNAQHGAAAFIAGAAIAQDALQAGPEQLQPFVGSTGEHLREVWIELVHSHPGVWDAELRGGLAAVIATVMPQAAAHAHSCAGRCGCRSNDYALLEPRAEEPADAADATITLQTLAQRVAWHLRSLTRCWWRPRCGSQTAIFCS